MAVSVQIGTSIRRTIATISSRFFFRPCSSSSRTSPFSSNAFPPIDNPISSHIPPRVYRSGMAASREE